MCPHVSPARVVQNAFLRDAPPAPKLRDDKPTRIELNGQPVDGERVAAVYRCRLAFEELADTDHPDIKHCSRCKQNVVRVIDFDDFERAIASKGCVWVPNDRLSRMRSDRRYTVGAVVTDYYASSSLSWGD